MVAVHTQSIQEAMMANLVALDHQCSASELVDDFILQFTKSHPDLSSKRSFMKGDPKAILMLEFFDEDQQKLLERCDNLVASLKQKNLGYAWPILQGEACQSAWEVRKAGLGLLRNLPGDARPVNLIEDCAVHPQDLPDYIADLEKLLQYHGVQYSMYAHAGAGELHVEPILNLKTAGGVRLFRQILSDTVLLVKKYRGSLSGEHGDGRLRGEFIPQIMGDKVYALFKEVKQIFDPHGIFNKGKIVDTPAMDTHLRYGVEKNPIEVSTVYDFTDQEGYLKLTEKCSGSGDCRKSHITGGTMCPSYMATRNERDTTRARANVLRQYLTGDQSNHIDKEEVKEIMDLCLSCKACKTECPSSVDVSKLKGEFMQSYYDAKGIPFRTNIIARFSQQMNLASKFAGIYNKMASTTAIRKVLNRMVGFHPERSLPLVANETLWKWYQKRGKNKVVKSQGDHKGSVYLFCDEFTNYQDAEIGKKAVLLMESLGYDVLMVKHPDSARTYLSKGLIREAKKLVNEQIRIFGGLINEQVPLVGIEPSAILGFRDEFLSLVDSSLKTSAERIAKHAFLFEEWFMQEVDKGKISKDAFTIEKKQLKIHGHCHQKSIASMTPTKRALSFPENYEARLIPSGCCGMAGSFGYEEEHYKVSMNIGELVLFKTVRELDCAVEVAASGTSCRHQIKDGTGRKSFHPVEILYNALKQS
jgi:Fe-S oxidoreductase